MKPEDFNPQEVRKLFDDALRRSGQAGGSVATLSGIMQQAYGPHSGAFDALMKQVCKLPDGFSPEDIPAGLFAPSVATRSATRVNLDQYRPDSSISCMAPRDFVGPKVGNASMFPLAAISIFTALGGVGKTSALMAFGVHIAAGRNFGESVLASRRVLMICVEEAQDELNRKFGATTHDWRGGERDAAADNMRLVSMVGMDPRLTLRDKNNVKMSPLVGQIIEWGQQFSAGLIILDHLQGFVDGDLNSSDTATMASMAANQIVAGTGAAVVFAAHVNKGQINADRVEAGFTSGSLAFENASRQVTGAIRLSAKTGKEFGIHDIRDYLLLEMPKNSYGPAGETLILRKEYVPAFHTVRVVPVSQVVPTSIRCFPSGERLPGAIRDYIERNPGTTRTKLDGLSGKDGIFKASKNDVRGALNEMLNDEVLRARSPTVSERKALGLAHQTKEILEIAR
jgi:hypothetical protein